MGRRGIGEFEHRVMLAVLQLGGEAHSVPVVLELEERTGKEVSQAAVFIVLRRLEDKGLLRSQLRDDSASGRTRRLFRITALGMRGLRESRQVLLRLWDGLEAVLDGA